MSKPRRWSSRRKINETGWRVRSSVSSLICPRRGNFLNLRKRKMRTNQIDVTLGVGRLGPFGGLENYRDAESCEVSVAEGDVVLGVTFADTVNWYFHKIQMHFFSATYFL